MGMDAHDDPQSTIAFLLKHSLVPKVYPRSPIAGSKDGTASAHADQLIKELEIRGWRLVKVRPGAPLHSADCGRRR